MTRLRCMVARWLRRPDRLDPPPQVTVRLTADTTDFCDSMFEATEMLRRTKL